MIGAGAVSALRERGQTVAVAESLTGGMVCAALVEVPGASAVVRGGVVAYATDLKHRLLEVDGDLLARTGPVHADVAAQMALGVREVLGADWGVATTGVAGPGAADGAPAGRVYLAVAGPLRDVVPAQPAAASVPVVGDPSGAPPHASSAEPAHSAGPDVARQAAVHAAVPVSVKVLELDLPGGRDAVRVAATEHAVAALLTAVSGATVVEQGEGFGR